MHQGAGFYDSSETNFLRDVFDEIVSSIPLLERTNQTQTKVASCLLDLYGGGMRDRARLLKAGLIAANDRGIDFPETTFTASRFTGL